MSLADGAVALLEALASDLAQHASWECSLAPRLALARLSHTATTLAAAADALAADVWTHEQDGGQP